MTKVSGTGGTTVTRLPVTSRGMAEQVSANVGQQLATNGQCHVGRRAPGCSAACRSSVRPSVSGASVVGQPVGQSASVVGQPVGQ